MSLTVIIRCDDDSAGYALASEMVRRFGADRVLVQPLEDEDEGDEDEVDEDMLLTILSGASQRMGDSPEARQLASLVHALQAPPAQRREELAHPRLTQDVAPPRGIPRPETLPYVKPNATYKRVGNTPQRRQAVDALTTITKCPECGAGPNVFCRSKKPTKSTSNYGHQHVHQARIDLVIWQGE